MQFGGRRIWNGKTAKMGRNASPLNVALIIDEGMLNCFAWTLLDASQHSKFFNVSGLIIQTRKDNKISRVSELLKKNGLLWLLNRLVFIIYFRLEKFALFKIIKKSIVNETRPLDYYQDVNKIYVNPKISRGGNVYRYGDEDLERISYNKYDVLIRCGSGILQGYWILLTRYPFISSVIMLVSESVDFRGFDQGIRNGVYRSRRRKT